MGLAVEALVGAAVVNTGVRGAAMGALGGAAVGLVGTGVGGDPHDIGDWATLPFTVHTFKHMLGMLFMTWQLHEGILQ